MATTGPDPEGDLAAGLLRPDLYYRLAGMVLTVPPLRSRLDDLPALARLMLDRAASYAPTSRNRGAYMFGLWMNANGYTQEEALAFAGEYANRVNPLKAHAFTEDEAAVAITSAYRYPPTGPWTRKRE